MLGFFIFLKRAHSFTTFSWSKFFIHTSPSSNQIVILYNIWIVLFTFLNHFPREQTRTPSNALEIQRTTVESSSLRQEIGKKINKWAQKIGIQAKNPFQIWKFPSICRDFMLQPKILNYVALFVLKISATLVLNCCSSALNPQGLPIGFKFLDQTGSTNIYSKTVKNSKKIQQNIEAIRSRIKNISKDSFILELFNKKSFL